MLHINDLVFRYGNRQLFDGATLHIPAGRKVALVGRNGTGKSTLFAMIRGALGYESGQISLKPGARIGHIAQEAASGDGTLIDTVVAADDELTALEHAAQTATDPGEIADIHTRLADKGAHRARARAAALLAGLGFSEAEQHRPCSALSGGWRMRVSLACTLFLEPDLLLLDEPTNYLDLEGTLWLEHYLASYPHTLLLISHDRDLLNRAVSHIAHLQAGKLTLYKGGYDRFETQRRQTLDRQMALKARQSDERRRIEAFVARFRAKPSKARQAQSRLKMLEKIQPVATMIEDRTTAFQFPDPEPLSSPLLVLESVDAGYGDAPPVLRGLDLRIDMDDRIALLGANGNGKSTFAKLLAGLLKPAAGRIRRPRKLVTAYVAQHQLDALRPGDSPFQHLAALMPEAIEAKIRARLGQFGFGIEKADRPVETLSGGEKARLLMALASFAPPHLLILDEPTNHLDIDSRAALMQALNAYDGAVLLISHDRYLLEACADRLWITEGGNVQPYDGDLESYRQFLLTRHATPPALATEGADKASRRGNRRALAEARQALEPLRRAVADAESTLDELTALRDRAQEILADARLYLPENQQKLNDITAKSGQIEARLESAETRWLTALQALEEAEAAQSDNNTG